MSDSVSTALLITALGLPMLFAALALLSGLMFLLTAITRERANGAKAVTEDNQSLRLKAAAIGVALARAELERGPSPLAESSPSGWRQYYHHRALNRNPVKGGKR